MLRIIDFSWHIHYWSDGTQSPSSVREPGISLLRLRELALERAGNAFLYHDPSCLRSAVVSLDQIDSMISRFPLHLDSEVAATGVLDVLRGNQLLVQAEQSALNVTTLLQALGSELAIVTDASATPVGLFVVGSVLERLSDASLLQSASAPVRDNVRLLTQAGDLAGAIAVLEATFQDFHSERLNQSNPVRLWCESGHGVSRCPCTLHPGSNCGRQSVA
jgi:hypothetical protein